MTLLKHVAVAAILALVSTAALAQQSTNGTPAAVPGVGPGGSGDQSGAATKPMTSGAQAPIPGSQSTDPMAPSNTTGQPAGDKPAQ